MRIRRPLYNMFYAAFLGAAVLLLIPRVASAQVELLQNPGFEGVYSPFNTDQTRLVAPGWTPWNLTANPGDPSHVNNQPTYRSATTRTHGGSVAQEFFTFYATHMGGVYQKVAASNGTKLTFSAWLNVWSTANDDPTRSEIPGQVKLQVGIDPVGGIDPTAAGIVWSAPQEFYDQWRELSVTATATGNAGVTVFVRSAPEMPVHHNHVFVDDASLHVAVDASPTPPPPLTATPTTESVVTATPPEIPSPTREGTVVPTTEITVPPPTLTPSATPLPPTVLPPTLTATPVTPSSTPSLVPTVLLSSPTPTRIAATLPPTLVASGTPFSAEFPYSFKYTVQYGNTLSDIANMYNSSVDAIVKANGIDDAGLIIVGQVLDIPTRTPPQPTPVPVTPPAPYLTGPTNGGIGTYIVQPGDDLGKIASLYHTTAWALAKLNGILNPNLIKIGQVLVVPGPGNNGGPGGGLPPPPKPERTHTIQFGETLYSISIRYAVPLEALMRANGIINPHLIYVGQVLRIP